MKWYTNLQLQNGEFPPELASSLPSFPRLERNNRDLSDQFFYRIGISKNADRMMFLAMYRRSFAIVGFVSADASRLKGPDTMRVHGPWKHGQPDT